MSNDFFIKVVNQALEIGYKNIGLTPQTVDIFMDKEIFKKFGEGSLKNYRTISFFQDFKNLVKICVLKS